jgi:ribosomal protein S18 acetylase RimI-like enzyme
MDYHVPFDPAYARSDDAADNWVKYVKSRLSDDSCRLFVAETAGLVVGYVGAVVKEYPPVFEVLKYGFIEEIAVTREYRQQGIGRQLAEAAISWLKSTGVTELNVKIDVANEASMALFRGRGFEARSQTLTRKL